VGAAFVTRVTLGESIFIVCISLTKKTIYKLREVPSPENLKTPAIDCFIFLSYY